MSTTWWEFAAEIAWKSTVLLIAASAVSLLLWRASAALRHLVWTLALGSLLALPVFLDILPKWNAAKVVYVPAAPEVRVGPAAGRVASHRAPSSPGGFPVVFAIWLTGALICLWRWKRGLAKVTRMRQEAVPLTGHDAEVREAVEHFGLSGKVQLLRSPAELVPLAAGIWKPVVLLPASASGWSRERLRAVLLHEMAHIRRRDSLTHALAEMTLCLYWFHPLVWLAGRRLRAERERACDDMVLRAGTGASDYASHLLGLAQSLQPAELAPVAVSMAGAHLETRIRAILNPAKRRAMGRVSGAMACVIAAGLVLPLAAMRPQATSPGVVSGTVYDPAGARVPGAVVISSSAASELKTTTDQEGQFTIGPLTSGVSWQLIVLAPGFAQHIQRADKDHLDVTLDLGQIQENLVVHGKGTAAVAASGPQRVRVGGNVVPAKLVYKMDPEYPADAQSRGVHGDVVLRAVISVKGAVLSPTAISTPDPQLSEAAVKAVREWRYEPSLLNGEPVETVTTITVNFELEP